jgi:hypothetical protein
MKELLEILKYILPSVIVFFTAYYLVKKFLEEEEKKRRQEYLLKNKEQVIPLKLQAYERLTLFLERISPENLVMRVNKPGMTARQLQSELLSTIRAEFEHNLAQQIYISPKAWEMIKAARTNTIKSINIAADNLDGNSPAIDLGKAILEDLMEQDKAQTSDALIFLKKEIGELF